MRTLLALSLFALVAGADETVSFKLPDAHREVRGDREESNPPEPPDQPDLMQAS